MQSTYAASLDVEWVIEIPSDRCMAVVKLDAGTFEWKAGTTHTLVLGEGDVAALYAQVPGVRIRPNRTIRQGVSPKVVVVPVTDEAPTNEADSNQAPLVDVGASPVKRTDDPAALTPGPESGAPKPPKKSRRGRGTKA